MLQASFPSAFMRAADNATKRREVADFDSPSVGRRTSPSGYLTQRLKRRVETLINILLIAHPPSESSLTALSDRQYALGPVGTADRRRSISTLPREADLAFGPPPSGGPGVAHPLMALTTAAVASCFQHLAQRLERRGKAKRPKLARHARQRLAFNASVGIAVDVVCFFMALSSFVESDPA